MSDTEPSGHNPADGQLPEGWDAESLDRLTASTRPICYGVLKPGDRVEGGVPLIRIVDIKNDLLDLTDAHLISKELDDEFSRSRLLGGEVLLSIQGTIGRVALAPESAKGANISRTIAVIQTDNRTNSPFVRYWLMWASATNQFKIGGTTRNSLNISDIRSLQCPLPPLAEQERIVEILEEQLSRLDAALESVRVVREKAAQFRRSLLHAAFTGTLTGHNIEDGQLPEGWQQITLGEIVSLKSGFAYKSRDWQETGVPVIKIANVRAGKVTIEGCSHINESIAAETVEFVVNEGDILMTLTGEIGAIGVYREKFESRLNQRVARIDLNATEQSLLRYLVGFLESPEFRSEMWRLSKGMAQPNISPKQVVAISMGLPPLAEQERIVEILEEQLSRLDAALAVADAIEKRSAALRRSLLHAAFTGRLTEQWRELSHV
jgi:type I restriction enzyme S subunit